MSFQSADFKMIGGGSQEDPANGIHLRWQSTERLGFPNYGFILYRRLHEHEEETLCFSGELCKTSTVSNSDCPDLHFKIHKIHSNVGLEDVEDLPISLNEPLEIVFYSKYKHTSNCPGHKMITYFASLIFDSENSDGKGEVQVDVFSIDGSVQKTKVEKNGVLIIKSDSITKLTISKSLGSRLVGMKIKFVKNPDGNSNCGNPWKFVKRFSLPVYHPDYPVTDRNHENLSEARELAIRSFFSDHRPDILKEPEQLCCRRGKFVKGSRFVKIENSFEPFPDDDDREDLVIRANEDKTAYGIEAFRKQYLILVRPYEGQDNSKDFCIYSDRFAILHEMLAILVKNGNDKVLHKPIMEGWIRFTQKTDQNCIAIQYHGSCEELVGLQLRIADGNLYSIEAANEVPLHNGVVNCLLKLDESPHINNGNVRFEIISDTDDEGLCFPPQSIEEILHFQALYAEVATLLGLLYLDTEIEAGKFYDYLLVHNSGTFLKDSDLEDAYFVMSNETKYIIPEISSESNCSPYSYSKVEFKPEPCDFDHGNVEVYFGNSTWNPGEMHPEIPVRYMVKRKRDNNFSGEWVDCSDSSIVPTGPDSEDIEDNFDAVVRYFAKFKNLDDLGSGISNEDKAQFIDFKVEKGSYSYKVVGSDLFGRESESGEYKVKVEGTNPEPPWNLEAQIMEKENADGDCFILNLKWLLSGDIVSKDKDKKVDVRIHFGQRKSNKSNMLSYGGPTQFVQDHLVQEDSLTDLQIEWHSELIWEGVLSDCERNSIENCDYFTIKKSLNICQGKFFESMNPSKRETKKASMLGVSVEIEGKKSSISFPFTVSRVLRKPPDPPPLPSTTIHYSSLPDTNEKSYFEYSVNRNLYLRTNIYRASELDIFGFDHAERKVGEYLTEDEEKVMNFFGWKKEEQKAVKETICSLNKKVQGQCYQKIEEVYLALDESVKRLIASLSSSIPAYIRLTDEPLEESSFRDTLPGKSRNLYFYRTSYVDGANNESDLSVSSEPISIPFIPERPSSLTCSSKEGYVELQWYFHPDRDLKGFRIYRIVSDDALDDNNDFHESSVPNLHLLKESVKNSKGIWCFKDTKVEENISYYYRITAESIQGSESYASNVSRGSALAVNPCPPCDIKAVREDGSIKITWHTKGKDHSVLIKRLQEGSQFWEIASKGWLKAGVCEFEDKDIEEHKTYKYKLKSRSVSCMESDYSETCEVSPDK